MATVLHCNLHIIMSYQSCNQFWQPNNKGKGTKRETDGRTIIIIIITWPAIASFVRTSIIVFGYIMTCWQCNNEGKTWHD